MTARVVLELPIRHEFDYLIPKELEPRVRLGSRVTVPFRGRDAQAVVIQLLDSDSGRSLKPLGAVLEGSSLLVDSVLELAKWIADYYNCPLDLALRSVLPTAVRRTAAKHQQRLVVRLTPSQPVGKTLTPLQVRIVGLLEERGELPLAELIRLAETTAGSVRRMQALGLLVIAEQRFERDPHRDDLLISTAPLALNPEQSAAIQLIATALLTAGKSFPQAGSPRSTPTFLLHGVTGSGKTEIYLQAIARTLELGGGAIVLVPEISLTPQTVERFRARFSTRENPAMVAVLHSHLSEGERHDEWHKIRDGRARIVIGARSAVFAPVKGLALIIVDEEHEHSYKQEETPRYHARDVAVMRGRIEGAVVLLGSATPSMESYQNALAGKYRLLELHHRASEIRMPVVRVVDMRVEQRGAKQGNSVISRPLREAISLRLERREQTILFLNRRGYSTSLLCERCGHVAGCPNCSLALTYHRAAARLMCHICGHEEKVPERCPEPKCGNPAIRYSGLGTERVEEVLTKLFPHAQVRRMDSDTLKRKHDYREILADFRTGKIDILLGTQMIAKGLDFPNVTLVGIIHADLSLHLADFRAAERTFQLLTQVSGRAGRGDVEGEVFVQTFTPFHPAIQYARRHDFEGFFAQEIEFRRQLHYPPFARVAMLTLKGRNDEKVKFCAEHLARELKRRTEGWPDLVLTGPAPAPLVRAETFYRHQIMLRTRTMSRLSRELADVNATVKLPDDVTMVTDVDPVSLL